MSVGKTRHARGAILEAELKLRHMRNLPNLRRSYTGNCSRIAIRTG